MRFDVFLRALADAPAASTAAEAFELLGQVLNDVEDSLSGVQFDPKNWPTDGRMYPPQADKAFLEEGGVTRYRNARHYTFIGPDGSIEITDLDRNVIFHKDGRI
jgi:hypothetical protein